MTYESECKGKTGYDSRLSALMAIANIDKKLKTQRSKPYHPLEDTVPKRVYHCPTCGYWHLTSKPWPSKEEQFRTRCTTEKTNQLEADPASVIEHPGSPGQLVGTIECPHCSRKIKTPVILLGESYVGSLPPHNYRRKEDDE